MVWVTVFLTTLITFLFIGVLCASQPKDVNVTSLNEHVKKMDAVLQEVQSHAQAQEQKYSAVLSSVLSQLTQTTEELTASRNVTETLQLKLENLEQDYHTAIEELADLKTLKNETQLDYATTMDEFAELKKSHNKTQLDFKTTLEEFAELKQSNNHSFSKLEGEVKSFQLDKFNHSAWIHKDFGFKATLGIAKHLSANDTIIFDSVNYNEGNGYNTFYGYFTAPVSGTYLFWTNIVYRNDLNEPVVFKILKGETVLDLAYGNSNEQFGTASAITISYLQKGENTWIITSKKVEVEPYFSTAGGVLIQRY